MAWEREPWCTPASDAARQPPHVNRGVAIRVRFVGTVVRDAIQERVDRDEVVDLGAVGRRRKVHVDRAAPEEIPEVGAGADCRRKSMTMTTNF